MENTAVSDTENWLEEKMGQTFLSKRLEDLCGLPKNEYNGIDLEFYDL